ncbi:hypothetical protein EVAR_55112_1 [Eumeta japonica]|uniref:Uncharacterized protein n=1 Tax=Eumeta variegata TaxID=151549 RepID=A0A4C1YBM5_EUMVA|nr:hypothetical protein EVAR_55112_1 [Eumeta japonica]
MVFVRKVLLVEVCSTVSMQYYIVVWMDAVERRHKSILRYDVRCTVSDKEAGWHAPLTPDTELSIHAVDKRPCHSEFRYEGEWSGNSIS